MQQGDFVRLSHESTKDLMMKKTCWLLWIFLILVMSLTAQTKPVYQAFQVDVAMGIAILQNGATGGEVLINPGYTLAGRYKVGIQFEGVVYNDWSAGSSMLTFDYYFMNKPAFRMSAGGGYGFYHSAYFFQSSAPPELTQSQWNSGNMGGQVRMEFQWHHLSLGMAYTFAPALYVSTTLTGYPTNISTYKNAFFGLTLGLAIGGGKK